MSIVTNEVPALAAIAQEVGRLRAAELIRNALAAYAFAVDSRSIDDLTALFNSDAEFRAVNFPAGGGNCLVRKGLPAILKICLALDAVELRHHISNVSIDVAPDGCSASSSAYFLHTHPDRMSGGVYEGRWTHSVDGQWQIAWWQVTLGWEKAFTNPGYTFSEPMAAHTACHASPGVKW
jgi:hypothetical protein